MSTETTTKQFPRWSEVLFFMDLAPLGLTQNCPDLPEDPQGFEKPFYAAVDMPSMEVYDSLGNLRCTVADLIDDRGERN